MARSFNGSTDKITLPGTTDLLGTFHVWSASAWIYPTVLDGNFHCIHAKRKANTDWEFFIHGTGVGAFNGIVFNSFGTLVTNTWQHCVVACDASSLISYINGVSVGSDPQDYRSGGTGEVAPRQIGCDNSSGDTDFFPGSIADCALWNVKLTAQEAAALGKGARPYQIRPSALLFWLPLDGIQTTEPDLSGFARNGTLTGTSAVAGPPFTQFTPRWPQFPDVASAPSFQAAWALNRNFINQGVAT